MRVRIAALSLAALTLLAACSRKDPPAPPSVPDGGVTETITGSERLGWDQRAADTVELGAIRYALYIDGTRSELAGVACGAAAAAPGFACTAPFPRLSAGPHTLELASFIVDGTVIESARSTALRVNVTAATSQSPGAGTAGSTGSAVRDGDTITTADGETLRAEILARDLDDPVDLAVAPDGQVFVAERRGTIRIAGAATTAPDERLKSVLAIALDPQFARTRLVYAIAAANGTFTLARYRESGGTFGDRAVLLDGVRASREPAAALRIGPDGKLYAAFDDGGDGRAAGDLASPNGKVLRLNLDGTTPDDQAGGSPTFASGLHAPRGLDWQPGSGAMWVADGAGSTSDADRTAALAVVVDGGRGSAGRRGVTRQRVTLPRQVSRPAIAFWRKDLLVSDVSEVSDTLLRLRVDPRDATAVASPEPLLSRGIGAIRAIATAPDGSIYFATATSVGRLVRHR